MRFDESEIVVRGLGSSLCEGLGLRVQDLESEDRARVAGREWKREKERESGSEHARERWRE